MLLSGAEKWLKKCFPPTSPTLECDLGVQALLVLALDNYSLRDQNST